MFYVLFTPSTCVKLCTSNFNESLNIVFKTISKTNSIVNKTFYESIK